MVVDYTKAYDAEDSEREYKIRWIYHNACVFNGLYLLWKYKIKYGLF